MFDARLLIQRRLVLWGGGRIQAAGENRKEVEVRGFFFGWGALRRWVEDADWEWLLRHSTDTQRSTSRGG